jgi:hypothetical protein
MLDPSKVMTTKNYDLFEPDEQNRVLHEGTPNYLKLENKIREYGWKLTNPMIVSPKKNSRGKYPIRDGSNRYRMAKKLGIEVRWMIDEDDLSVAERNEPGVGIQTWRGVDWLTSNLAKGKNPAYAIVDNFQKRTRIPLTSCLELFKVGSIDYDRTGEEFRTGRFKIQNPDHADAVGRIVEYCTTLDIPLATRGGFVRAISQLLKFSIVNDKNLEIFMKRIRLNVRFLRDKNTSLNYLGLLSEAYNYKTYPRIDFVTEVRNAMAVERREHAVRIGGIKRKAEALFPTVAVKKGAVLRKAAKMSPTEKEARP